MKKLLMIPILLISFVLSIYSQAPYEFNYQAVARDASGIILENTPVKIKISILQSNLTGSSVYSEIHSLTTNSFGLINLKIGTGNNKIGLFEGIKWGIDNYFLKIEMDKDAGNNFKHLGTSQLLSVPYSLFSGNGVQFDLGLQCDENTEGTIRYNKNEKIMEFCNGESWISFGDSGSNTTCGEDYIDTRDGQVYPTVKIGSQCWMAKNFNYGVYKESIYENNDGHSDVSNNGIVEKYAFENNVNNFIIHGGLYDWNEMMNYSNTEGGQGICPDGWHIPSDDEIVELIEEVGGFNIGGKKLMVGGSSGFNFLTSGGRTHKGAFSSINLGSIWTSTEYTGDLDKRAYNIYFTASEDNVSRNSNPKERGKSVRCMKN
jgi:uncharacterized protein (TIGR02145 family)